MVKVAVIGAAGYTGAELIRLLARHPEVEIVGLASRSQAGRPAWEAFPHLEGCSADVICTADPLEAAAEADVAFLAVEHGRAAKIAAPLLERGLKVIDLSADFRLKDPEVYKRWYKADHPHPELLPEAVYGLPELHAEKIRAARLVANPGCYPVAVILAVAPIFARGLAAEPFVVADCKSGISGAGRSRLQVPYLFSEANENVRPYSVAKHRHAPEMEDELTSLVPQGVVRVLFCPQVVPMTRGILACCYVKAREGVTQAEVERAYAEFYRGKPFVRVKDDWPQTKWVLGSNYCDVHAELDPETGYIVACSAIDNLVKGASGNAVQNMNLMFGLPETAGLDVVPLYP